MCALRRAEQADQLPGSMEGLAWTCAQAAIGRLLEAYAGDDLSCTPDTMVRHGTWHPQIHAAVSGQELITCQTKTPGPRARRGSRAALADRVPRALPAYSAEELAIVEER